MAHSQNRILLIVEGAKTEPKLFEKISSIKWNEKAEISIIDIKTNIYSLYNKMIKYDEDFFLGASSTIDVLKEMLYSEGRTQELEKLNYPFTDIYLFFDFEYQDRIIPDEKKHDFLNDMQNYFSNETENGLLLINYPMIEAYRDFIPPAPSLSFRDRDIDIPIVKDKKYKQIVGERGFVYDIKNYDLNMFEGLFIQNVMKANYLLNNDYSMPEYEIFINDFVYGTSLLNSEFNYIDKNLKISILCSCIYIFVGYFGKTYYDTLKNKSLKLIYNEI